MNPGPVTNPSTNRAHCRITCWSSQCAITKPNRHLSIMQQANLSYWCLTVASNSVQYTFSSCTCILLQWRWFMAHFAESKNCKEVQEMKNWRHLLKWYKLFYCIVIQLFVVFYVLLLTLTSSFTGRQSRLSIWLWIFWFCSHVIVMCQVQLMV